MRGVGKNGVITTWGDLVEASALQALAHGETFEVWLKRWKLPVVAHLRALKEAALSNAWALVATEGLLPAERRCPPIERAVVPGGYVTNLGLMVVPFTASLESLAYVRGRCRMSDVPRLACDDGGIHKRTRG